MEEHSCEDFDEILEYFENIGEILATWPNYAKLQETTGNKNSAVTHSFIAIFKKCSGVTTRFAALVSSLPSHGWSPLTSGGFTGLGVSQSISIYF